MGSSDAPGTDPLPAHSKGRAHGANVPASDAAWRPRGRRATASPSELDRLLRDLGAGDDEELDGKVKSCVSSFTDSYRMRYPRSSSNTTLAALMPNVVAHKGYPGGKTACKLTLPSALACALPRRFGEDLLLCIDRCLDRRIHGSLFLPVRFGREPFQAREIDSAESGSGRTNYSVEALPSSEGTPQAEGKGRSS